MTQDTETIIEQLMPDNMTDNETDTIRTNRLNKKIADGDDDYKQCQDSKSMHDLKINEKVEWNQRYGKDVSIRELTIAKKQLKRELGILGLKVSGNKPDFTLQTINANAKKYDKLPSNKTNMHCCIR